MASLTVAAKAWQEQAAFARQQVKIALETSAGETASQAQGATAGGDALKLRGLPAISKYGAGGAIAGSDPLRALLTKERHRENGRRRTR